MRRLLVPLWITRKHLSFVLPKVDRELAAWRSRAEAIPNPALREQALASMDAKRFHCEGGSVFAAWEPRAADTIVRFIVAFQTISDYLDNLCDRTDSLNETDFRMLHTSMLEAVLSGSDAGGERDYYRHHPHSEDGGYLRDLVGVCRDVARRLPGFPAVREDVARLVGLYIDLQVYKHLPIPDRLPRLETWFSRHSASFPFLYWWEFAAACGSTLGVFALVAEAARLRAKEGKDALIAAYFPWICGLHILLDYFIDQEEDRREEDLNLVSYYPDSETMHRRMSWILDEARRASAALSESAFHATVVEGLLGLYLSDPKVRAQGYEAFSRDLIKRAGWRARLVYRTCVSWRGGELTKARE